jgi:hypothetical protein
MYKLYSFKISQYVMPFLYFFDSIGLFPPRSVCYKNLTKPQAENDEYEYIQLISQVFRNYQNNSISLGSWLRGMWTHTGERKQLNICEGEIHMSLLRNTEWFQSDNTGVIRCM